MVRERPVDQQHRRAGTALVASTAPALPLGLHPGGTGDPPHLVSPAARFPQVEHGDALVDGRLRVGAVLAPAAAPACLTEAEARAKRDEEIRQEILDVPEHAHGPRGALAKHLAVADERGRGHIRGRVKREGQHLLIA